MENSSHGYAWPWWEFFILLPQDKLRIWNKRNEKNTDKMHHFTQQDI